jgi:hypothetical protein
MMQLTAISRFTIPDVGYAAATRLT